LLVGQNVGVRGILLASGRIVATGLVVVPDVVVTATPRPSPTPMLIPQGECPLSQAYWQAHADTWPTTTLMLGNHTYPQAEALAILNTQANTDASVRLASQLIVAKLNIANGSAAEPVGNIITQADLLLSQFPGALPYNVLPTAPVGPAMVTNAEVLSSYNNNLITPNCTQSIPQEPTDTDGEGALVVIQGPVQVIDRGTIRIYDFNILVDPTNDVLRNLHVGDVARIEGILATSNEQSVLIATTIQRVSGPPQPPDPSGPPNPPGPHGGPGDDGPDNCDNPPPDHAPAHGWRERCEGVPHDPPGHGPGHGADNDPGNNGMGGGGMGMGD
jgi:hypothetical protein